MAVMQGVRTLRKSASLLPLLLQLVVTGCDAGWNPLSPTTHAAGLEPRQASVTAAPVVTVDGDCILPVGFLSQVPSTSICKITATDGCLTLDPYYFYSSCATETGLSTCYIPEYPTPTPSTSCCVSLPEGLPTPSGLALSLCLPTPTPTAYPDCPSCPSWPPCDCPSCPSCPSWPPCDCPSCPTSIQTVTATKDVTVTSIVTVVNTTIVTATAIVTYTPPTITVTNITTSRITVTQPALTVTNITTSRITVTPPALTVTNNITSRITFTQPASTVTNITTTTRTVTAYNITTTTRTITQTRPCVPTTTTPTVTAPTCASCSYDPPATVRVEWKTTVPMTTFATFIEVVVPDNGTYSTSGTIYPTDVPPGWNTTATTSRTHVFTFSGTTVTITYPTVFGAYGSSLTYDGNVPIGTAVNAPCTSVTQAVVPLPSHPLLNSVETASISRVDPLDRIGLFYVAVESTRVVSASQLMSAFPNFDPINQCTISLRNGMTVTDPSTTGKYVTVLSRSICTTCGTDTTTLPPVSESGPTVTVSGGTVTGPPVTEPGPPVTASGPTVTAPPVTEPGEPTTVPGVPVTGPPVTETGPPIFETGSRVFLPGTILRGPPIFETGPPVFESGTPVTVPGTPVTVPGTPIVVGGSTVTGPGRIITGEDIVVPGSPSTIPGSQVTEDVPPVSAPPVTVPPSGGDSSEPTTPPSTVDPDISQTVTVSEVASITSPLPPGEPSVGTTTTGEVPPGTPNQPSVSGNNPSASQYTGAAAVERRGSKPMWSAAGAGAIAWALLFG